MNQFFVLTGVGLDRILDYYASSIYLYIQIVFTVQQLILMCR